MHEMSKSYICSGAIIAGVIAADRITKVLVSRNMTPGDSFTFIPKFMNITYSQNRGASFGMLANHRWVFMVLSVIALAAMAVFLIKNISRHPLLNVALSFLIGGGLGNMYDRLFVENSLGQKVVIDFFEFDFVDFAIFNVADMFITFGAIIMGVYVIFFEGKVEKRLAAEKAAAEAEKSENSGEENDG